MIGSCPVLPADNIWNTPVDTLPVLANSATMVNTIGASRGFHADFGAGMWDGGPIGIPFVTVPGTQPKYPASFLYDDESDPGPYAVPLNAPIEGGPNATGDRHAIAIDTDNCRLYELYRAFPGVGIVDGRLGRDLRPALERAAAAHLDVGRRRRAADHAGPGHRGTRCRAARSATPSASPRRRRGASSSGRRATTPRRSPARSTRAWASASASRRRSTSRRYPAEVQVILRAMKKYGIILADNGSAWFISGKPDPRWNDDNLRSLSQLLGSNFEAVDATVLRISPDSGAARQSGTTVTVTPVVGIGARRPPAGRFAATVDRRRRAASRGASTTCPAATAASARSTRAVAIWRRPRCRARAR